MDSSESGPPVIPRPRSYDGRSGVLQLTGSALRVTTDGRSPSDRAATALGDRLVEESNGALAVRVGGDRPGTATIHVERCDSFDWIDRKPDGAYELLIEPDGGTIRAIDRAGLQHAIETVAGLLATAEDGWELPACRIRDWPAWEWRGLLVDPARGHIPVDRVESLIDRLARAKMNRLHVHAIDGEGCAVEFESRPELTSGREQYYSIEDVERIVAYAAEREITVVPEFELPAHATPLLEAYPELRCSTADEEASDWSVCLGSEATYDLLADVAAELAARFETATVHLGTDEWAFDTSWCDCSACRRRMDAEGLETERELFYDFLRRATDILEGYGLRTAVWNEQIDVSDSPPIPRDLLVQFWLIRPDENESGPTAGNSLERFLEEGFDVVNSYVPATYVDRHATESAMLGWTPARYPTVPDEYASQIEGGELLAWSGWKDESWEAYYRRALPSAIPVFADRVWNGSTVEDRDSFVGGVGRHVLGPEVNDPATVFEELGGLLLPTENDEYAHRFESLRSRSVPEAVESYENLIDRLRGHVEDGTVRFPDDAEAYVECLEWLVDQADQIGRGVTET